MAPTEIADKTIPLRRSTKDRLAKYRQGGSWSDAVDRVIEEAEAIAVEAEVSRLQDETAGLREALEPFRKLAIAEQAMDPEFGDHDCFSVEAWMLRAALEGEAAPQEGEDDEIR